MELDYGKYAAIARQAAAEGCVLLENKNHTLPIENKDRVSVFGRTQINTYYCGTGSGGMVNPLYVVSILEGIKKQCHVNEDLKHIYERWIDAHPFDKGVGWAQEPWSQEEMPVTKELVERAAQKSDIAVVVIGRTAGEDQDNTAAAGAYYLSETEETMLSEVCGLFNRVAVVLNVGGIIDMSWVKKYRPGAVLYVWQGGCEGGSAAADVLTGRVNPCGKLTDTIARSLEAYPAYQNFGSAVQNIYAEDIYVGYRYFETFAPKEVLYPFGYGLSYTNFSWKLTDITLCETKAELKISVKNTGSVQGKQVLQLYVSAPQGKLGKPVRTLIAFKKTGILKPQESENITIKLTQKELASYDDSGKTGYTYCWIVEKGKYELFAGFDVRSAKKAAEWEQPDDCVVEQEEQAMAPVIDYVRLVPGEKHEENGYAKKFEAVPKRNYDLKKRMCPDMPRIWPEKPESPYLWEDVRSGNVSLERFLNQFSNEELACLTRGEGMCSPKVTPGTAAAFGGVTDILKKHGMPVCCCSDGPSGIRMDCGTPAFSMPSGTALASTFNTELTEQLFSFVALELVKNKIDTLLGPGINIHRYPLCGRNFEYFSEDPLLTGFMAAAELRGLHTRHVTGTIKHFACNNQEFKRNETSSIVSERALREIYLKGFELAVKRGGARSIMTSYNPVNGIWSASNYDLLTTILRNEWGYKGMVMTDWWAKMNDEGEEASSHNTAAMIRAQNDIFMVVNDSKTNSNQDNTMEALNANRLCRAELIRNAVNICGFILQSNASLKQEDMEQPTIKNLPKPTFRFQEKKGGKIGKEKVLLELPDKTIEGGTRIGYSLEFLFSGCYSLRYKVHTCQSELAQIPFSFFWKHQLIHMATLKGENNISGEIRLETLEAEKGTLELYFRESGVTVDELSISKL